MDQKEDILEDITIYILPRKSEIKTNTTFVIDKNLIILNQCGVYHPKDFTEFSVLIAVKELIIEWDDYQTEVSGVVSCADCLLFSRTRRLVDSNLLRFVKPPGRKTCFITVPDEEMKFIPLRADKFEMLSKHTPVETNRSLIVKRKHTIIPNENIELKLKPLFDENTVLPIKNAHITVELSINYIH